MTSSIVRCTCTSLSTRLMSTTRGARARARRRRLGEMTEASTTILFLVARLYTHRRRRGGVVSAPAGRGPSAPGAGRGTAHCPHPLLRRCVCKRPLEALSESVSHYSAGRRCRGATRGQRGCRAAVISRAFADVWLFISTKLQQASATGASNIEYAARTAHFARVKALHST